jgi:capsule polysaccharide export protein KpsE/RkpR
MLDEKVIQLRLDSLETRILKQVRQIVGNGHSNVSATSTPAVVVAPTIPPYDDTEIKDKISKLQMSQALYKDDFEKTEKRLDNRILATENALSGMNLTPINSEIIVLQTELKALRDDLIKLQTQVSGFDQATIVNYIATLTNRVASIEAKITPAATTPPPTSNPGLLGGLFGGNNPPPPPAK